MKRALLAVLLIILSYGCAKEIEVDKPADYYKELGDSLANEGKYSEAAERYEQALIRAETPAYVAEVQLSLADSYFLAGKYEDAIAVYEVYIEVYKDWENVKLATVRLGLAYFNIVRYTSQDQTNTERSLYYLEEVKKRYPDLVEEYDVDLRIELLRDRLAKKEMIIAKYYARILKSEPELLRYKYIINHYSDTSYYGEAVYRAAKLLLKQDNVSEAKLYADNLEVLSPDSKYVPKVKKLIDKYNKKKEKENTKK